MTEVADLVPSGYKVITEKQLELVEPGEAVATTKEEEWISKKKTEVTNTKQIETRVKRQVVLEDGKVVEDTGPVVTTNTTEDTETQEHHQTELRKLGEDDDEAERLALEEAKGEGKDVAKFVIVPNPDGLVREVKEKRVISREEVEEVKETEDVRHLGDITDEDYLEAVRTGQKDLRGVLKARSKALAPTGPKIIRDTSRSNKTIDTEEKRESSSIRPDGRIVTETERTTEHEEIKDDEVPEEAPEQDVHLENSQRYYKSKDQEEIEYLANGVKVGTEMRYKGETTEFERRGDGIDEPDWDSLSARVKRRTNGVTGKQPHRYRDPLPSTSPMDRKDALTRKPLDFDQEEENRKVETSKWLENHFGSESRSSRDSLAEEDEEEEDKDEDRKRRQLPPKTSYFNVTIKSQTRPEPQSYVGNADRSPSRQEIPERDHNNYFQGVSDWSDRRRETYAVQERSPYQKSPIPDYGTHSPVHVVRYEDQRSSPARETTPTPPQRKKAAERRQRISQESRYDSGYRTPSRNDIPDDVGAEEPLEEPPPDYSPPVAVAPVVVAPAPPVEKKHQKTRFAAEPVKHKSGNIIGQSIRKLVGKIRSASAERKAKQRAKRSPSPPSYQKGQIVDHQEAMETRGGRRAPSPAGAVVHKYYLGEDPFGGSIYGRENKYDGVRPARSSRRNREEEQHRSQSTLGRFSKSTSRLANAPIPNEQRFSQTLPRKVPSASTSTPKNNTINVSIINTVSRRPIANGAPAKPARTYKSNLARSQSFNVNGVGDIPGRRSAMNKSNPHLNRLDEVPAGLKSPALISSINRSTQNLTETIENGTGRFARNGFAEYQDETNRRFVTRKSPEFLGSYESNRNGRRPNNDYEGDIYEPPTRLRDNYVASPAKTVVRRGSNSSNDYSETYRTTSRNDDPHRPSVTNTVQSFSKKTIPNRDGRGFQTIESTEKKSITKSRYVGEQPHRIYDGGENRRFTSGSPVVIEVRNNNSYRK